MATPQEKKQKPSKKVKREISQNVEKMNNTEEDTKNIKFSGKNKRVRVNANKVESGDAIQSTNTPAVSEPTKVVGIVTNKDNTLSRKKKRKTDDLIASSAQPEAAGEEIKVSELTNEVETTKENKLSGKKKRKTSSLIASPAQPEAAFEEIKGKSKKSAKNLSKKNEKAPERNGAVVEEDVYHISSSDGDFSKGMKKWIMEYHQKRPGLKVLQQRIDDFITAHEEKLEQEREEKMEKAAEGGWTVVVHHKGRKKTTDAESGVAVGSVALAAVKDNMAKKKTKEVGLDFYRFQKREAQKNEIMMLRSKFEEDKKRIQQQRAERKFRPY